MNFLRSQFPTILIAGIVLLSSSAESQTSRVVPGIEVLREQQFAPLKGKRVGLITNPTGVDSRLRSTVDILADAPGVKLVALFGPEHGVRGDFEGERTSNRTLIPRQNSRSIPCMERPGSPRRRC